MSAVEPGPPRSLGTLTASLAIVASMIGTGVFTTTGFLVRDVGSPGAIVLGWMLGGLAAFSAALCYAELATALPVNGGEYQLLSRIYHPAVGFMAGVISLVVGFSAPSAAAALACARYLGTLWPELPQLPFAIALILVLGLAHGWRVQAGSRLQNLTTGLQIVLIVAFVIAGAAVGEPERLKVAAVPLREALLSPGLAVGLIYIAFAYTGWNAAVYMAGELERPERVLPRACLIGVGVTTVLYVALNVVFLMSAPAAELAGRVEVGAVASEKLFGAGARGFVVALIALGLMTTVSALLMTGPRVYEAMGVDHRRLGTLRWRHAPHAGPSRAIALQTALSIVMILSTNIDSLLMYCGLTLSLTAALTAGGVIVLRRREPDLPRPYRAWGYPFTPLLFVVVSGWMIGHTLFERPAAALASGATLVIGLILYLVLRERS